MGGEGCSLTQENLEELMSSISYCAGCGTRARMQATRVVERLWTSVSSSVKGLNHSNGSYGAAGGDGQRRVKHFD